MQTGGVRAMVVLLCLGSMAAGDTLVTRDGKTFEGKIISRGSSIVFEAMKYGSKITVTIPKSNVASLTVGPVKPEAIGRAVRPAAHKLPKLPPEPKAPPVVRSEGATYYVIPLRGEVGTTLSADLLTRCLADAAKRKPTAVVLHIDSPGGLIAEVEPLVAAIRKYKKDLRIVVLVKRAISAAAVTAMACDEIYVQPSSIFGAATAFRMTRGGRKTAVDEKMQSLWRAMARSAAAVGGHSPLLADAMIDASLRLHVVQRKGKKVVVEGAPPEGGVAVTRAGKLLTMTAGEAIACGLAAEEADSFAELGMRLGHDGWTECRGLARPLAEYRAKVINILAEDMARLKRRFDTNMIAAGNSAPWRGRYQYHRETRKFTRDSWRRWNERSRKCAAYLTRAQNDLARAAAIAEKFPRVFGDPKWLRVQEDRIKAVRKKIADESQKSSPF